VRSSQQQLHQWGMPQLQASCMLANMRQQQSVATSSCRQGGTELLRCTSPWHFNLRTGHLLRQSTFFPAAQRNLHCSNLLHNTKET